ncbi:deoxyribose-phosphate aldolase [Babesia caballi]|uniref:Deoxyribose-phosphate aldolase n=1 Tax=Babesia caballi TaxID=5871 RepID=A0AAV4LXJ3_BABCB|nr:deoxyribose-phosphate aldolase [Babesia caballi]
MLDGCEVGTEVRGRVYKGNDNARTGGIPQFHAATDRTVEERLGDLGRSTALDEAKVAGVHISTQIGDSQDGDWGSEAMMYTIARRVAAHHWTARHPHLGEAQGSVGLTGGDGVVVEGAVIGEGCW